MSSDRGSRRYRRRPPRCAGDALAVRGCLQMAGPARQDGRSRRDASHRVARRHRGDGSAHAERSGQDFYFSVEGGYQSRFRRADIDTGDGPSPVPSEVAAASGTARPGCWSGSKNSNAPADSRLRSSSTTASCGSATKSLTRPSHPNKSSRSTLQPAPAPPAAAGRTLQPPPTARRRAHRSTPLMRRAGDGGLHRPSPSWSSASRGSS